MDDDPNWIIDPEKPITAWIVVPGVALSGLFSPSPTSRVLLGKIQVPGIWIVPAGRRMVKGGGLVIPAHGLALQVMLVGGVVLGTARVSMTAPDGYVGGTAMLRKT